MCAVLVTRKCKCGKTFTGDSRRRSCTQACKKKRYNKAYYAANGENIRENERQKYINNPQPKKDNAKKWQEANKEKVSVQRHNYHLQHRAQIAKTKAKHRHKPENRHKAQLAHAKRKKRTPTSTPMLQQLQETKAKLDRVKQVVAGVDFEGRKVCVGDTELSAKGEQKQAKWLGQCTVYALEEEAWSEPVIWESQAFRNNTLNKPTPREQTSQDDLATFRSLYRPILQDCVFIYYAHAGCEEHRLRNAFGNEFDSLNILFFDVQRELVEKVTTSKAGTKGKMYVSSQALQFLTPWITHLTNDNIDDRDVMERVIDWEGFEREEDSDVFRYKSQADTAWTIQLFSFLMHAGLGHPLDDPDDLPLIIG